MRTAYEELCALFRARTREERVETLVGVDSCCEPVYNVGETLASASVRALGILTGEGPLSPVRLPAIGRDRYDGDAPH